MVGGGTAGLQEHFDCKEIDTRVAIEVLPHTQWVKVWAVKESGPSG